MGIVVFFCTLVLLALVVLLITAPLRAAQDAREDPDADPVPTSSQEAARTRRDQLEAAREAKYREIRDAELDYRTGKLSADDYKAIDTELRSDALSILDSLEALDGPQDRPDTDSDDGR